MSPSRSIANASAIRFFGIRHIDFGEQRARTGLERVSNARHLSGKIAAGDFRHADDRANSGSDASCLGFYRQGGGFLIPVVCAFRVGLPLLSWRSKCQQTLKIGGYRSMSLSRPVKTPESSIRSATLVQATVD
jgi:hypothetical protein